MIAYAAFAAGGIVAGTAVILAVALWSVLASFIDSLGEDK